MEGFADHGRQLREDVEAGVTQATLHLGQVGLCNARPLLDIPLAQMSGLASLAEIGDEDLLFRRNMGSFLFDRRERRLLFRRGLRVFSGHGFVAWSKLSLFKEPRRVYRGAVNSTGSGREG